MRGRHKESAGIERMTALLAIPIIAFLASLALTPAVRRCARRFHLVDHPDGHRKIHDAPIPLGGGVAVLVATLIAVAAVLFIQFPLIDNPWKTALLENKAELLGLLAAATVLCAVGLVDDRKGLRGRQKVLGQLCAVGILVSSGLVIRSIAIFGWQVDLGPLSIPFTVFWLLGAINSLNLIDGIDGLATSVGIILTLTIAAMAFFNGHVAQAIIALSLAGSLAGFLVYNFPPASIFLGDAGSMVIGLAAGSLAISSSLKGPATVALAAPIAIWAIPIFDSGAAILRRKLTGRSIYTCDRGHLHHCLQRRGLSNRQTVGWVSVFCGCTAAGALISVYSKSESYALLSVVAVVGTLVVTKVFGYTEFLLLTSRLKAVGASFFLPLRGTNGSVRQACVRLQGSRQWEGLWIDLTDSAERLNLNSIRLDVNVPSLHEVFHASWDRVDRVETAELWRTEVPLFVRDKVVGRVEITGTRQNGSVSQWLSQLSEVLQSLESRVVTLAQEDGAVHETNHGVATSPQYGGALRVGASSMVSNSPHASSSAPTA